MFGGGEVPACGRGYTWKDQWDLFSSFAAAFATSRPGTPDCVPFLGQLCTQTSSDGLLSKSTYTQDNDRTEMYKMKFQHNGRWYEVFISKKYDRLPLLLDNSDANALYSVGLNDDRGRNLLELKNSSCCTSCPNGFGNEIPSGTFHNLGLLSAGICMVTNKSLKIAFYTGIFDLEFISESCPSPSK